ncbi:MAG: MalY/PatB family protein [Acidimicrobiia bacterium]
MPHVPESHPRSLASDSERLERLFGSSDLLSLWIAEPYVDLAPPITSAMELRATEGWYGYEARPPALFEAFWEWMRVRHTWTGEDITTTVSPSVGTSIGTMIEQHSSPGDGVILQPPVFTDFKPLAVRAERQVVRNSLVLTEDGYRMDFGDLEAKAAVPTTTFMILCNPHNPIGRAWMRDELRAVAEICAANDVFVLADEIHADLVFEPNAFVPFAQAAAGTGVSWAATHGPIKTFGLAGVCDTLILTDNPDIADGFRETSSRLHLTRNNVFALAAFEAAYRSGGPWLDDFTSLVRSNAALIGTSLPDGISLAHHEATYLAWLDLRGLGLDVPELAQWLTSAGLAFSPGHWFGREGAGFARMTIAVPGDTIREALERLTTAVEA